MTLDAGMTAVVKAMALECGFARVGIAPLEPARYATGLQQWVAGGLHAGMDYMAANQDLRLEPTRLVETAACAICLAVGYAPQSDEPYHARVRSDASVGSGAVGILPASAVGVPPASSSVTLSSSSSIPQQTQEQQRRRQDEAKMASALAGGTPTALKSGLLSHVARYARGRDYHKVLKTRAQHLMDRLREEYPFFAGRAFVDSAPVMERTLAAMAGLGWIGRNGCIIVPGLGTYVVLCEILCNLPLRPDRPLEGSCGECGRCDAACPTGAIRQTPAGPLVDCRRCISYLTIEHAGPIPREYWPAIGTRLFGCDACQEACPHNRHLPAGDAEFQPRGPLAQLTLADLLAWTPQDWDVATRGSPIRRAGHEGILRNAIIAAGNSSDPSLIANLKPLRTTASEPVGELIDWAIDKLAGNVTPQSSTTTT